jgi:hypothetical protein
MKTRATVGLIIAALAMSSAQAAVIYSETFTGDGTFGVEYTGFNWNTTTPVASDGVVTFEGSGEFRLNRAVAALTSWSWSDGPLQLSMDLGSNGVGGSGSLGIYLHTRDSGPWPLEGATSGGVSFQSYWPSSAKTGNNAWVAAASGGWGTRQYFELNTDTTSTEAPTYTFTMTIQENAVDSTKFDVTTAINGTDQITLTLDKAGYYGIDGATPFRSIGVRGDGSSDIYLDNITLSVIPEPASLGMLGAAAVAMLLRRRFRG